MWNLVPWPRIKLGPPALGVQSLSYWTIRESLDLILSSCIPEWRARGGPDCIPISVSSPVSSCTLRMFQWWQLMTVQGHFKGSDVANLNTEGWVYCFQAIRLNSRELPPGDHWCLSECMFLVCLPSDVSNWEAWVHDTRSAGKLYTKQYLDTSFWFLTPIFGLSDNSGQMMTLRVSGTICLFWKMFFSAVWKDGTRGSKSGFGRSSGAGRAWCVLGFRDARTSGCSRGLEAFWSLYCHCSVAQSCLTLCNPLDYSTPGFPVLHYLPEFALTHIHWVGDSIPPSHPLSSPSPAFNLS